MKEVEGMGRGLGKVEGRLVFIFITNLYDFIIGSSKWQMMKLLDVHSQGSNLKYEK